MIVYIPPALRNYTEGRSELEASAGTLAELFLELDGRFPGLRFRVIDERGCVREHIRVFVDERLVTDLSPVLESARSVHVICALSGG